MANYQSQYTGEQIDEGIGKANKALVTPDATPDGPRIVAINTDGTQQNLTLGDGLTVADGVISASGGGSGGGDKALIVYVFGGYRPLKVYFDNEGTGTVEGIIQSSSKQQFYYFTEFTNYVYFKGDHEDDISVDYSGKAVNCNVEFGDMTGYGGSQFMKVSNITSIGMVTIHTSTEPQ